MKKICSIFLALALLLTMSVGFSASAANAADVGAFESGSLAPGFTADQVPTISQLIRQEYNRGVQTRNFQNPSIHFDYGNSSGEFVHAWIGQAHMGDVGNGEHAFGPFLAMNQDFTGGGSSCGEAFSHGAGWCCILVTTDSIAKNKAYTVRDGIAQNWASGGGTNSMWGMPTSNQFWITTDEATRYAGEEFVADNPADTGYYLVQNFDEGFAILADGYHYLGGFMFYETGYDPIPPNDQADSPAVADVPFTDGGPVPVPPTPASIPADLVFETQTLDTTIHQYGEEEGTDGQGDATAAEGEGDATAAEGEGDATAAEGEGDVTAEGEGDATTSTVVSKIAGTAGTVETYLFGMPLKQALPILIGIIAAVVVILAVIIILVVIRAKKKAASAAGAEEAPAGEAPAEEAPTEKAPTEDSAE